MKTFFACLFSISLFTACQRDIPVLPGTTTILSIISINPASGPVSTLVTIKGTGFKTNPLADTVKFNGKLVVVQLATDTTLTLLAPAGGTTGIVTVTTSDGTATGPIFTYNTPTGDVYIVGDERSTSNNYVAGYYKNGQRISLTNGANNASATSITLVGNDVYVTGYEKKPRTGYYAAKYWKNGIEVLLTDGIHDNARANAIAISGSDVYVVGQEQDYITGIATAKCWKNGNSVLLTDGTRQAGLSSIALSGNDVYIAGVESNVTGNNFGYYTAKLWKNGVPTSLTDGSKSASTKSLTIIGNDIYVEGYEANGTTVDFKYWKNGIAYSLLNGSFQGISLAVVGNDIYVGGVQNNAVACSKNGISINLPKDILNLNGLVPNVNGIAVFGNDVYMIGAEYTTNFGGVLSNVVYWKNGIGVSLGSSTDKILNAIIVK